MVYVKAFILLGLAIGIFIGSMNLLHGLDAALVSGFFGGLTGSILGVVILALVRNLSNKVPRFGDVSHSAVILLNGGVKDAQEVCQSSLSETNRPYKIDNEDLTSGRITAIFMPTSDHLVKDKVTFSIDRVSDNQARVKIHSQPRNCMVIWDGYSNFKNIQKLTEYIEQHAN